MLGSLLRLAIFFIFASLTLRSSGELIRVRAAFQKADFFVGALHPLQSHQQAEALLF